MIKRHISMFYYDIDKHLDTHAIKSYYVTIDTNNLLDEMDHKVLAKYQNIIFDKYGAK